MIVDILILLVIVMIVVTALCALTMLIGFYMCDKTFFKSPKDY